MFWSSGGSRWKVDTNWVLHNNRDPAIGFIFSTYDMVCPHSPPAWSYYQDSGAFIAAPEISVQPACRSDKGTGHWTGTGLLVKVTRFDYPGIHLLSNRKDQASRRFYPSNNKVASKNPTTFSSVRSLSSCAMKCAR